MHGRRKVAKRFGWKVGDRIPMRGTIWTGTWEFNVPGSTTGADRRTTFASVSVFDYLEERRNWEKGLVGWYTFKLAEPGRCGEGG